MKSVFLFLTSQLFLRSPSSQPILADYLKYSHIDDPHHVSFTNHCHLKQYLLQIDINFIAFCPHLEQRSFADVGVSRNRLRVHCAAQTDHQSRHSQTRLIKGKPRSELKSRSKIGFALPISQYFLRHIFLQCHLIRPQYAIKIFIGF